MPQNNTIPSDLSDLPPVPPALITALEKRYPNRCPQIEDSERLIWMNAGKAELVAWLRSVVDRRTKIGLDKIEVSQNV